MPRYKLLMEYDGTGFVGWQRQKGGGASVQQVLEGAIAKLCAGSPTVFAAGRTDAGVHATGQVVHTDVVGPVECVSLVRALNAMLAPAVVVRSAEVCCNDSRFCRMPVLRVMSDIVVPFWLQAVLACTCCTCCTGECIFRSNRSAAEGLPQFV